MSVMCIAIGNSLREDDGVAHRVLELLDGVVKRDVVQLVPELAAEIAQMQTVVFIDAAANLSLTPIAEDEARSTPLGHSMTSAEVVGISRRLFGFTGDAFLCQVPGVAFGAGEGISATAAAGACAAVIAVRDLLTPRPV